jgi:hypothetical protein
MYPNRPHLDTADSDQPGVIAQLDNLSKSFPFDHAIKL